MYGNGLSSLVGNPLGDSCLLVGLSPQRGLILAPTDPRRGLLEDSAHERLVAHYLWIEDDFQCLRVTGSVVGIADFLICR